nr:DNA internalization-related competence protein ComEC/Rec2 [Pontibacillus yanchengensis]
MTFLYIIVIVLLLWRLRMSWVIIGGSVSVFCYFAFTFTIVSPSSLEIEDERIQKWEGRVISAPINRKEYLQFNVKDLQKEKKWRVTTFSTSAQIAGLDVGSICRFTAMQAPVQQARNPGAFDFGEFLQSKGISGSLHADSKSIACKATKGISVIHQFREFIIVNIQKAYSPSTASWIMTLVLGNDEWMDEDIVELFQRWNLSHLLAISGLHVGLCITFFTLLSFRTGFLTKESIRWLLICLLPLYSIIAGGAPSVVRAVWMAEIILFMTWLQKRRPVTDIISFLVVVLLLIDPYLGFQLGFQFSFLVTFALLLSKQLFTTISPLRTLLHVSIISQLTLIPIQVHQFYILNPVSIVANVFLVPIFSIILLPFCIFLAIVNWLPVVVISVLDQLFTIVIQFLIQCLHIIDQYLYIDWVIGEISLLSGVGYYSMFFIFMYMWEQQKNVKAFIASTTMVSVLIVHSLFPYFSPVGRVTMLDVGQGDTIIIEWPYRKHVLMIDAAGKTFNDNGEIFTYAIKPYLHSRGIGNVNTLILTHKDRDHMGSAELVLDHFHVETLLLNPFYQLDSTPEDIDVKNLQTGDTVTIENITFVVLHPKREAKEKNENSLVLSTSIGGKSWLLTGDIGKETELEIVQQFPGLTTDVLKVSHHGSRFSTSDSFVKEVNPSVAWISVGEKNTYGHPAKEVIDLLAGEGIYAMRTDLHGAVYYEFKEKTGTFFQYLP